MPITEKVETGKGWSVFLKLRAGLAFLKALPMNFCVVVSKYILRGSLCPFSKWRTVLEQLVDWDLA